MRGKAGEYIKTGASVVKAVAKLDVDLAGVVEVKAAECEAIVE